MKLTADYLVGRRFRSTMADLNIPDFTCTGYDPDKGIRVHAIDGGKYWLPVIHFRRYLVAGVIVESEDAPFVLERGQYPTKAQQRRMTTWHRLKAPSVRVLVQRLRTALRRPRR